MEVKQNTFQKKVIKIAIEKYGTQQKLARRIKSNQVQINRYATGKRDMPVSIFLKILRLIGGKIELPDN
jgi:DNA-binding transcriptional regulator YdaS (Cro superfamily)